MADEREEIARIIDRLESSDPDFDDCTDAANMLRAILARAQGPGEAVAWRYRFRSQWALSGWSYVDGPERPDLNEWDGFSGYEIEPLYAATPTREA